MQPALERPAPGQSAPAEDFRAVYERELSYVWCSLRRLGASGADLEDLAHDTFLTAYRRRSEYDPGRPIRPWLFGIAYRLASDFRRRRHRNPETLDDMADAPDLARPPDDALAGKQDQDLLLKAMEALTGDKRAAFIMHDVDGHSAPEISAALSIPLNTVYSRIRVARDELAREVTRIRSQRGSP